MKDAHLNRTNQHHREWRQNSVFFFPSPSSQDDPKEAGWKLLSFCVFCEISYPPPPPAFEAFNLDVSGSGRNLANGNLSSENSALEAETLKLMVRIGLHTHKRPPRTSNLPLLWFRTWPINWKWKLLMLPVKREGRNASANLEFVLNCKQRFRR